MYRHFVFLSLALIGFAASCLGGEPGANGSNVEWFIAVAEGFPEPARHKVETLVVNSILEARSGDVVHLVELPTTRSVLTAEIDDDNDADERLDDEEYEHLIGQVFEFFAVEDGGKASGSLQIDLPLVQTLFEARRTDHPVRVVLCGDPVYEDPNRFHEGWSWRDFVVPTDTALVKNKQSVASPFVQGVGPWPQDALVSVLSHRPKWTAEHIHRAAVTRCLRLFVQERGAHLVKVTADPATAFDFRRPRLPPRVEPNLAEEFGMKLVSLRSAADYLASGPTVIFLGWPDNKPPLHEVTPWEEDRVNKLFERALASKTHTLLAMRWQPDRSRFTWTDVDWRLFHPGHEQHLSYKTPRPPFAKLLGDTRFGMYSSGGKEFGDNWEFVVVRNEDLPQVEAWVNLFFAVGSVNVEVVQVGQGKRLAQRFTLNAPAGDEGSGVTERADSAAWRKVELPLQEDAAVVKRPQKTGATSAVAKTAPAGGALPWAWDDEAIPNR